MGKKIKDSTIELRGREREIKLSAEMLSYCAKLPLHNLNGKERDLDILFLIKCVHTFPNRFIFDNRHMTN